MTELEEECMPHELAEMVAACERTALGPPKWRTDGMLRAEWGLIHAEALEATATDAASWIVRDMRPRKSGALSTCEGMPSWQVGGIRTAAVLTQAINSCAGFDSIEHAIKLGMLLAGAPEHELSRFGLGRLSLLHAAAEVRRRLYREMDDGE